MTQKDIDHRRQEVQQIVKNASDQLNAEGVDARNYVEQLAWLFFLKAFDEAETRKEQEAVFDDKPYERRLRGICLESLGEGHRSPRRDAGVRGRQVVD